MGQVNKRVNNPIESQKKRRQEQSILDSQDIAVSNTELLIEKEQQILDLQELVVMLSEQIQGGNQ